MKLMENGIIEFDDVRIAFRNFSGEGSMYNREGDRNFAIVLDEDMANFLIEEGWNVKVRDAREDGDEPFRFLTVKIKLNGRVPVYLKTGDVMNRLDEESISILDQVDIARVDLDIRPYDWVVQEGTRNEKRGRTAYLQSICVTQEIDRFALKYGNNI